MDRPRYDLLQIYQAALAAVDGASCVEQSVAALSKDTHWSVIAIGKAADAMALGAQAGLGPLYRRGLVISKPGHERYPGQLDGRTQVLYGDHPVPGAASLEAGQSLVEFILATPLNEPILLLISGGASSLVEILPEGLELGDLAVINQWLLGSGLSISEMNRIRKRCSAIKGGRLWNLLGARRVSLLYISDVPDDDPAVVGSGLLFPQAETGLSLSDLSLPGEIRERLRHGEIILPPSPCPSPTQLIRVASQIEARNAALGCAESLGYRAQIVEGQLSGDAAEQGRRLAEAVMVSPGQLIIWGGEVTVKLPRDPGRGGRCQHLALAAAKQISGHAGCYLLAAGTDGSDGPGEDSGALVDSQTQYRGENDCFVLAESLQRADSGRFLEASGDLVQSGATGTNVMDLVFGLNVNEKKG